MVGGLNSFKEWFLGYEQNYAIIGGTACDLLMNEAGLDFRVTKDIDMVLIIEALDADFGSRFWEYIKTAGYKHLRKSTSTPRFYRFSDPNTQEYPQMIELFSRRTEGIALPPDAVLTPLPIEDDVSSLSAIILDDEYYYFLKSGVKILSDVSILDAAHLIPFKAKAWLDLSKRRENGDHVDSKKIKKHKDDVLSLSGLLSPDIHVTLPKSIMEDMQQFLSVVENDANMVKRVSAVYGVEDQ